MHWCQAFFFNFSKCDVIDNNMCETFNGVIIEARCKPIISILEEIKLYVMRRLVQNKEYRMKWKTEYGLRILTKLDKNKGLAGKWDLDWKGAYICQAWDISGVPCQHDINAIYYEGEDLTKYLANSFKRNEYLKAYEQPLHLVRGLIFWPKWNVEVDLPPYVKRFVEQPKKEKRREPIEGLKKTRMLRVGRIMKYAVCYQQGHVGQIVQYSSVAGSTTSNAIKRKKVTTAERTQFVVGSMEGFGSQDVAIPRLKLKHSSPKGKGTIAYKCQTRSASTPTAPQRQTFAGRPNQVVVATGHGDSRKLQNRSNPVDWIQLVIAHLRKH
ncbi:Uncharacterized protein TCM_001319 [Theobroma cacao]|uniref:Zinc finger PMZ-type domain-containing protein n=1 Tax=Theobroma cacao TaxID=3641 RepID=A0A061DIF9_THECC|nr:Uncharacterized protein TCM_001319 [Theobroma cacao]